MVFTLIPEKPPKKILPQVIIYPIVNQLAWCFSEVTVFGNEINKVCAGEN